MRKTDDERLFLQRTDQIKGTLMLIPVLGPEVTRSFSRTCLWTKTNGPLFVPIEGSASQGVMSFLCVCLGAGMNLIMTPPSHYKMQGNCQILHLVSGPAPVRSHRP